MAPMSDVERAVYDALEYIVTCEVTNWDGDRAHARRVVGKAVRAWHRRYAPNPTRGRK